MQVFQIVLGLTLIGLSGLTSTQVHASEIDGSYGRFTGDVNAAISVGGGIATTQRFYTLLDTRLRFLDTAGITLAYEEWGALQPSQQPGSVRRAFQTGVELRPFFPAFFLKNWQQQKAWLDLAIESFGIDLGVWWPLREATSPLWRPGWLLGCGFELPLQNDARGFWIRFAFSTRWAAEQFENISMDSNRIFTFSISFSFHHTLNMHIVDANDRRLN